MDNYSFDEQTERSYDHRLMKRLLGFAKPYWHNMVLAIGLILLITLGDLANPYFIKLAIDSHINANGRIFLAYEIGNEPIDGVIVGDQVFVEKTKVENADSKDMGTVYSYFQQGKYSYFVPGTLPNIEDNISIREENGTYTMYIEDESREILPIDDSDVPYIRKSDIDGLKRIALIFLGIILAVFVLNYSQTMLLQYTGQRIIYDMRSEIFSHLQSLSLSFFDNNPVGRLVTRITNDTETLNDMYTNVLVNLFKDIFLLIGIVIIMFRLDHKLALVSMAVVPIIAVVTVIFRKNARKAHREVRDNLSRINSFLAEHISGMRIIQIFHQEPRKMEEFDQVNDKYYRSALKENTIFAIFRPFIEFIHSLALSILLWYGGKNLIRGNVEFGVLFAFVSYIGMFFRPINDLTEKYNILQSAMASAEKIFSILDEDSIIEDRENPIPLPEVEGRIEFKDVWFAYEDEDWVLKDVSFTIEPGETIAFVGATGAGKTSIINLICRFYDIQRGEILIDGHPIDRVPKKDLRSHIGVVLQDVFLFTGDIEYNIRLNNTDISREKVEEVSRYVNAHHFIEKMPHKYDEKVMERGSTLSAGQRQLLAFARALVFDPSILILDEATASIDTETEELIQDALEKLIEGRTTIAIAHRLSTIQHADKIIVLHKGKIAEMGTHSQLLAKRGLYHQLYELQYKENSSR